MPEGEKKKYSRLVQALEERFAPANQTELYRTQLRERHQKAVETLPELGQDIKRLTYLAYPTAPYDVQETLAKEQFIDALRDSDMRLRVKQARPANLNDAVRHAVELEAFNKAEIKRADGQGFLRQARETEISGDFSQALKELQNVVVDLQKEVRGMKGRKNTSSHSKRQSFKGICYGCGQQGHVAAKCPNRQTTSVDHKQRENDASNKVECSKEVPAKVWELSPEGGMFVKVRANE